MLPYERRVMEALLSDRDPAHRDAVVQNAALALGAMPEVIRFGIGGQSVLLTVMAKARRAVHGDAAAEIAWLESHPIGLVRQWVRALRSLVLFADQEMLDAAAATDTPADPSTTDSAGTGALGGPAGSGPRPVISR